MARDDLYRAALAAEDAWMGELRRVVGRGHLGDIRYTDRAKGDPGSALRVLHDASTAATDAWIRFLRSP